MRPWKRRMFSCLWDSAASYDHIDRYSYDQAGKAYEIVYWDQHSRFCPVCGTPTELKGPIMKKCPHCGNEMFPSVSPAVLVLIRKGEEILLVHARNFRGTFHGLVAGFLETGETLEQCVEREVWEETGLTIQEYHLFWQPAVAVSEQPDDRFYSRLCQRGDQIAGRRAEFRLVLLEGQPAGNTAQAELGEEDDRLVVGKLKIEN